jgi:hypothetical protein
MLLNILNWLSDIKLKNADNEYLCYWAQVILLLIKINLIILEELLYKFWNVNNTEYVAALGPKAAEKSLDKLI